MLEISITPSRSLALVRRKFIAKVSQFSKRCGPVQLNLTTIQSLYYPTEHEENVHRDESSYIETETTTHTPNVTYGKSFHVVTHTRIGWADNLRHEEGSVLNVKLEIVWTGWCPFKGTLELAASDLICGSFR